MDDPIDQRRPVPLPFTLPDLGPVWLSQAPHHLGKPILYPVDPPWRPQCMQTSLSRVVGLYAHCWHPLIMNDSTSSPDEYDTPLDWTVIGLRHLQRPDLGSESYGNVVGMT